LFDGCCFIFIPAKLFLCFYNEADGFDNETDEGTKKLKRKREGEKYDIKGEKRERKEEEVSKKMEINDEMMSCVLINVDVYNYFESNHNRVLLVYTVGFRRGGEEQRKEWWIRGREWWFFLFIYQPLCFCLQASVENSGN
jgi:hypothetical protein